jgi:hypothetical protein
MIIEAHLFINTLKNSQIGGCRNENHGFGSGCFYFPYHFS